MLRVELGGGTRPRGGDWVNVDALDHPAVHHRVDFAAPGMRLPFPDASVDEIYSCHCLEHVDPYGPLLHEIVRVCRAGARVEIRLPHWLQSMALCGGHEHTISPRQVSHWTEEYVADWFGGCARRLKLLGTEYVPGEAFDLWRRVLPALTEEETMRVCPDACHEVIFTFEVIANQ